MKLNLWSFSILVLVLNGCLVVPPRKAIILMAKAKPPKPPQLSLPKPGGPIYWYYEPGHRPIYLSISFFQTLVLHLTTISIHIECTFDNHFNHILVSLSNLTP